jgi:hypothetical protein
VQVTEEAKSPNCADKLVAMHLQSISTQLAWIIAATFVVVFMHCALVEAYLGSTAFVTSVTTVTVTSTSQVSRTFQTSRQFHLTFDMLIISGRIFVED